MLGFVGLGYMGSRIARRLVDAGYPLGVYNRTREKTRALAERGARVYDSARELAADSDTVLSMLADDDAVEEVMLGPEGVVAVARFGGTIIDLSSVHPDTSRRVASAARPRNVAVLDASVSGSTPQAEDGSLVVFVGGERAAFEQSGPILRVIGSHIFYLGPSGAGGMMKLVTNSLLGVGIQALAEALVLGQRAGLDKTTLLDVLEQTAVVTPGQKHKLENVRSGDYPVEFPLRLMFKDLLNIERLARQTAVPTPAIAAAQRMFTIEQAKNREEDFSAIIRTMEELAGMRSSPEMSTNGSSAWLHPAT
ncbi:MAG: NAD(P)-dependent oxidoreductase [Chloroflexi bacterium]|nr:MAG: NAD(P)-dependent oxidoreductase [Chloroflexota bacterium]